MAASRPTILRRNHAFVFALCDSLGRAMDGWRGIKNGVPRVDLSQRYPRFRILSYFQFGPSRNASGSCIGACRVSEEKCHVVAGDAASTQLRY